MKKVISYSLYGDIPMYTEGAVRSAKDAKIFYPDWECRFYLADDVPENITKDIQKAGAIVIHRGLNTDSRGMMWRFEPLFEEGVDIVQVRDTDSPITKREVTDVAFWLATMDKNDFVLHLMKDRVNHINPIMGCSFGVNTQLDKTFKPWFKQCFDKIMTAPNIKFLYGVDESFLKNTIYEKYKKSALLNTSVFNDFNVKCVKPHMYPRLPYDSFIGNKTNVDGTFVFDYLQKEPGEKRWVVLIITNNKINYNYYAQDKTFNPERFVFFNVGKERMISMDYQIYNSCDIENYEYLGVEWAEYEVFHNIYKLDLFKGYDYLGFLHHDHPFGDGLSQKIEDTIKTLHDTAELISFNRWTIAGLHGQKNLFDENNPDIFDGRGGLINGVNSVDAVFDIYKKHTHTLFELKHYMKRECVICSSFLANRTTLNERFFPLVEKYGFHDMWKKFKINKKNRLIGNTLERFLAFVTSEFRLKHIEVKHEYRGGLEILKMKDDHVEE